MKKIIASIFITMILITTMSAQTNDQHFRVYDGKGVPTDLDEILKKISDVDVVFLGEMHDDSVAHSLQFEIFKKAFESNGEKRDVMLSLEMFESDVQIVVDEYLKDLITEKHFLSSSRPWGNYETDYRPLVEFAKEKKLKVIAANAPRRYVNMVSRLGRGSLEKLTPEAKKSLAPLPFGTSSVLYSEKFNALMEGHGSENILDSQTLWDSTMAFWISKNLKKKKNNLIIHLNGSFHTESRLGTVEQLLKFKPKAKILVVTMRYEDDFTNFDKSKHTGLGDFVILTDAKQPRSKR
jgi:uncharacterized iron-regulated protein